MLSRLRDNKGYTTNLTSQSAPFVIDAYHQLSRIEKSFRMSKHDLQARPVYHYKRESIEAHLTSVFAALAVSHWIEHQTGWSIKKLVWTARRYRTVQIRAGRQTLTAADPLPDDLRDALATINHRGVHQLGQVGSYAEISASPAMPIGSIGPTRMRLLRKLRDGLSEEEGRELTNGG